MKGVNSKRMDAWLHEGVPPMSASLGTHRLLDCCCGFEDFSKRLVFRIAIRGGCETLQSLDMNVD